MHGTVLLENCGIYVTLSDLKLKILHYGISYWWETPWKWHQLIRRFKNMYVLVSSGDTEEFTELLTLSHLPLSKSHELIILW